MGWILYTRALVETKIRLARFGAKKKPFYRVVVAGIRSARDGRFLEVIGHYDPKKGIEKADFNKERASYWLSKGAQPTQVVKQIMKSAQAAV